MPRRPRPHVNWKRLTILTFGFYIGLAILVVVVFEVLLPMFSGTSTPGPSGFNYAAAFSGLPKTLGWILAGIALLLAPLTLLVRAADALTERLALWVGGKR